MKSIIIRICVSLTCLVCCVLGHGMLLEPPSRSSAWRAGFPTPKNDDDNALFCGGFGRQQSNGGRCGVCGDPWDAPQPRRNEAGGIYATGIIVRNYTVGQVIPVRVQLTVSHKGWFEFRLCPNNDVTKVITHECLNRHLLSLADGSGSRYYVRTWRAGYYDMYVKLPDGLTCTQCVFQWKYHVANSWGTDPVTKVSCTGCGPQEEFYGCSDIGIRSTGNDRLQTSTMTSKTTAQTPAHARITVTTTAQTPAHARTTTVTNAHAGTIMTTTVSKAQTPAHARCTGKGIFMSSEWDKYCQNECKRGQCPSTMCNC